MEQPSFFVTVRSPSESKRLNPSLLSTGPAFAGVVMDFRVHRRLGESGWKFRLLPGLEVPASGRPARGPVKLFSRRIIPHEGSDPRWLSGRSLPELVRNYPIRSSVICAKTHPRWKAGGHRGQDWTELKTAKTRGLIDHPCGHPTLSSSPFHRSAWALLLSISPILPSAWS